LWVKGELVGGLDVVKDMCEGGSDLGSQLGLQKEQSLEERVGGLIKQSRVMLFMKGLPSAPKCGFSRTIVEILDKLDCEYDSFNILEDDVVRQELKRIANWPTYPMLFCDGELVGGLDVVKEMNEAGELKELLIK
jgi:Grx4 family monothiol glutaredoxin